MPAHEHVCPHLEHLAIGVLSKNKPPVPLVTILPVPWTQMRELDLAWIHPEHNFGAVFFQCTRLERARLSFSGYSDSLVPRGGRPHEDVVEFASLKLLYLRFCVFPDEFGRFGRYPALKILDLQENRNSPSLPHKWDALLHLVEHAPRVENLTICGVGSGSCSIAGSAQGLRSLLQRVPLLNTLAFICADMGSEVIAMSSFVDNNGHALLQLLKELHGTALELPAETPLEEENNGGRIRTSGWRPSWICTYPRVVHYGAFPSVGIGTILRSKTHLFLGVRATSVG